ncbi:MAG TPA: response regulator, partial [Minicystis sp.]|nr:response regulator [Minicystis sp.]
EQAGGLALARGDVDGAASWTSRGLELARHELAVTGEETFEVGVVTFGRKLADALVAAERYRDAAGVLAELEALVPPQSAERGSVDLSRARIHLRTGRDAASAFERLLESDRAARDAAFAAACWRGLAEALGPAAGAIAVAALQEAQRIEAGAGLPLLDRAATSLALARAIGRTAAPREHVRAALERAAVLAERAAAPALHARILGELATERAANHELEAAIAALEQAIALASEAGDVEGARSLRAELASARASDARAEGRGRRVVLVVEDDAETQESLSSCLSEHGYVVLAASTGKQALRVLGAIERPIAIFVDLMMPVMNGWELVAALRDHAAYADIPVAVLSAVADKAPEGIERLQKPVSLAELLGVLARAETRVVGAAARP